MRAVNTAVEIQQQQQRPQPPGHQRSALTAHVYLCTPEVMEVVNYQKLVAIAVPVHCP